MKLTYITLKESEKHPLCFSLSAVEELCEKFGGLEEMVAAIKEDSMVARVKAITTVLDILMRAGRHYCQEMGIEMPPPIKCNVGDLIDITDGSAVSAIFSTMSNDTARAVEAKGKNA